MKIYKNTYFWASIVFFLSSLANRNVDKIQDFLGMNCKVDVCIGDYYCRIPVVGQQLDFSCYIPSIIFISIVLVSLFVLAWGLVTYLFKIFNVKIHIKIILLIVLLAYIFYFFSQI